MKKLLPLLVALIALLLGTNRPSAAGDKLFQDPDPNVRMKAALAQLKANNAAAVPVLIDLLAALPVGKRAEVEEALRDLAGDWAPSAGPRVEDEIARKIYRDAWAAWWANTDGPSLLAMIKKRTLSPDEFSKVQDAIRRLGDKTYAVREKAVVELVARGRPVLPLLKEALRNSDLEVSRRAQRCIVRIEEEPAHRLPGAAFRLLGLRKPAQAVEALLAYLPFAEEETLGDAQTTITALALKDGKPDPALLAALENKSPTIRAVAGEAMAMAGAPEGRTAARKLLTDADLTVRLRVALALASRDIQAVPVLIQLIGENLPGEQTWQVHDLLRQLAGDKAPPAPEDNAESRKKASADWAAWWKENAAKVDLSRIADPTKNYMGYVVVCRAETGIIEELGRDHKPRWSFGGIQYATDAWMLPNNRVLVSEYNGRKVSERDTKGKILWEKPINGMPYNIQPLPQGHVLIVTSTHIMEIDRAGKQILSINNVGSLTNAYKAKNGNIIAMTGNGVCLTLDAKGKQLKSFTTNRSNPWMDLLPSGKILVATNGGTKIAEYDANGKMLMELDVPQITTACGLPNGNVLASCHNTGRIMELDRRGKILWEYKAPNPFRARPR
jgi:HEAT repeat protein